MSNAVVICLDTVRADTWDLVDAAAELDALAVWSPRALRFTAAQSTAPWTLPAVASVLTGLYPNQHGAGVFATQTANLDVDFPAPLPPQVSTLPRRLADRGFATAGFVAHPFFRRQFGLHWGFEQLRVRFEGRKSLVEAAEAWLAARETGSPQRRFFMYIHFMEAHQHFQLDPQERDRRIARLPSELRKRARAAVGRACNDPADPVCRAYLAYVAAVYELRESVAAVLTVLERRRLLSETVVVLLSDHGEEFLEHAEAEKALALDPRGSYGVGHGHSLYQELLRIPLAIWHPRIPGREVSAPVSLADVAPTLEDWLGVEGQEVPGAGSSLAPLLAGDGFDAERPLFSSSPSFGPPREAVVKGGWKLVSAAEGGGPLVFDLTADAGERTPLRSPAREAELAALLEKYRAVHPPLGSPARLGAPELEELQSLGYLRGAEED